MNKTGKILRGLLIVLGMVVLINLFMLYGNHFIVPFQNDASSYYLIVGIMEEVYKLFVGLLLATFYIYFWRREKYNFEKHYGIVVRAIFFSYIFFAVYENYVVYHPDFLADGVLYFFGTLLSCLLRLGVHILYVLPFLILYKSGIFSKYCEYSFGKKLLLFLLSLSVGMFLHFYYDLMLNYHNLWIIPVYIVLIYIFLTFFLAKDLPTEEY